MDDTNTLQNIPEILYVQNNLDIFLVINLNKFCPLVWNATLSFVLT